MNIVEVIRRETAPYTKRIAVIDGDVSLNYGQLLERVDDVSKTLRGQGISAGRRIGFMCEDGLDYVVLSLGILSLNAALVPIAPATGADEIESILDRIDVHALIYETQIQREAGGADMAAPYSGCRSMSLIKRTVRQGDPPGYADLHPAFIRFSSGTTGLSKGVLLSHRAILDRTDAADAALRMSADDTVAWVLSMSFHFVVTILLFLRRSATIVMCGHRFPDQLLMALKRHPISFVYASPFHYRLMTQDTAFEKDLLGDVRLAVSTAMKMPHDGAQRFEKKFGKRLSEAYGIIEVGLPAINLPEVDDFAPNSVGHPLPDYDVRIDAPDDEGIGEVLVRGKGLFDAYYAPWQPQADCLRDGYFPTGDLGRIDSDGRLFLLGRDKDVINFAGMKIFPQEVETVLNRHPAVEESLVFGTPHPDYGDMPAAKLVLSGSQTKPDIDQLRRYCYQHLASYMVPKQFRIVDRLERTQSGKIKRTKGRDQEPEAGNQQNIG